MADDSTSMGAEPSPRPIGRPTDRTPEVEERIAEALRNGATRRAAAAVGGIAESTLRQWCVDFPAFSATLTRAEGECEATLAALIRAAAPTDWRAADTLLKKRFRDQWGDTIKQEMDIDVTGLPREALEQLAGRTPPTPAPVPDDGAA